MSDNVRYFLKNFLNLVFLRIISRIIPIVMMTYCIIPIIGFSSFGKLEFAKILNYFLKIIISYGFIYSIPKIFYDNKDNNDFKKLYLGKITGSILIIRGILILFCALILFILFLSSQVIRDEFDVIFYFFLVAISSGLFPICIYQGIEKIHVVTILNSITKLLFYLTIPFYIKSKADICYYPIAYSIIEFLRLLLSYSILIYFYKIPIKVPKLEDVKKHIFDGFSGFSFSFYMLLYNNFPMLFLKMYFGNTTVGLYKLGTYISQIIQQILEPFLQCFYPIINKKIKTDLNNGLKFSIRILAINIIISSLICTICYIFPDKIIMFFSGSKIDTSKMNEIIQILKINSITVFFTILSSYIGVQILRSLGYKNLYSLFLCISFILSLILHFKYVIIGGIITSMYSILTCEILLFTMVVSTFLYIILLKYKIKR